MKVSIQSWIKQKRIMIIELESQNVGLIVDAVSEVIYQKVSEIEPPPIEIDGDNQFFWGIGKFENRLLTLLNPTNILEEEAEVDVETFQQVKDMMTQVTN